MALRPSRVFSIPFGVSFLDALTDALLEGPLGALIDFAGDPLTLAQATLYVPTRRAGRALAAKLAERLRGRTTVLPRIVPLGETDALELSWLADPSADAGLRPAIGETQRLLLLAELVAGWSRAIDRAALKLEADEAFTSASGGAGIISLAADLARLIDSLHLEAVPLDQLTRLDASDFQEMWRISAAFLAIAGEHWPRLLAERGRLDPVDRHGRLMRAFTPTPGARRVPPSDHRGRLDRLDRGDRRAHREHRPPFERRGRPARPRPRSRPAFLVAARWRRAGAEPPPICAAPPARSHRHRARGGRGDRQAVLGARGSRPAFLRGDAPGRDDGRLGGARRDGRRASRERGPR